MNAAASWNKAVKIFYIGNICYGSFVKKGISYDYQVHNRNTGDLTIDDCYGHRRNTRRVLYMSNLIKNIDHAKVVEMEALVDYQEGRVVSRTLAQGKPLSVTLFAFDKNEEISSHSAGGDAMVYILDGEAEITVGDEKFNVKKGETIVMPAGVPHALLATERFKMLLTVVFSL